MLTFFAGLSARIWTALAAIGGVLALLGGAWLKGRQSGIDRARAKAMEQEQLTRRVADAAATDAQRDGASKRLRDGSF